MQFGGTLGYNWQIGSFVYGVEGDIGWSGLKSSTACGLFTCETKNQFLGTLRGRAGYAFDNLMPYMTAGLAVGDIKATSSNPVFPGASGTKLGWTIGASCHAPSDRDGLDGSRCAEARSAAIARRKDAVRASGSLPA